jgi:hypothetical protein
VFSLRSCRKRRKKRRKARVLRDLLRGCGILGAVWLGATVRGILICEAVRFWGKEERKSMDSVPSNAHGNLDEQISQLMQCKPLSEQEVLFLHHDFRFFCPFWVVPICLCCGFREM